MQQLSIQYFYPLTEQIELDLDYTPCLKYEEDKRRDSLYVGNRINQWGITSMGIGGEISTSTVFQSGGIERMRIGPEGLMINPMTPADPKAGYWAITEDFRIYRKSMPFWVTRKVTELIFGWKWKTE